ncbi:MAG: hypothetical protein ACK56I_34260, partial [bacterium]
EVVGVLAVTQREVAQLRKQPPRQDRHHVVHRVLFAVIVPLAAEPQLEVLELRKRRCQHVLHHGLVEPAALDDQGLQRRVRLALELEVLRASHAQALEPRERVEDLAGIAHVDPADLLLFVHD